MPESIALFAETLILKEVISWMLKLLPIFAIFFDRCKDCPFRLMISKDALTTLELCAYASGVTDELAVAAEKVADLLDKGYKPYKL